MLLDPSLLHIGFVNPPGGTHTSRTMMLAELRLLFAACPAGATLADYSAGVLEDNALRKETQSNRHRSLRSLRELYALDTNVTLFRVLRELWDAGWNAWFPDGPGGRLMLIRFVPEHAEYVRASTGRLAEVTDFVRSLIGRPAVHAPKKELELH